jgi:serine protease Do
MSRIATHVLIAPLACLLLFAACSGNSGNAEAQQVSERASGSADTRADVTRELPDFAALVERYGNAVVNVEVIGTARAFTSMPGGQTEDPLAEFFKRFGIPMPGLPPEGSAPLLRGAGSGFIVSSDGYILTNAHVVAQADEVTVTLTDRREFPAQVIGTDIRTDVAVLKIDAKDLPTVKIGDPSKLRPGEWVLAIGSPFGLENSATAGIVSATARAVVGETDVPFIQTDVAVNPGNSGGPLFNLRGEVVGINSMIFSRTGGYMGISFAVPIDVAMDVRDQLIKTGRVVRGRIGVAVQNVDAPLARSFGLDRPRGALVSSVEEGGPAARAGLKPGDVILAVNGEPVDQSAAVSRLISRQKPGQQVTLTIWRGKKEQQVKVGIAELKEPEMQTAASKAAVGKSEEGARLGLVVRPLTPEEKQAVDTRGNIVVEAVSGPAARAGVQPSDIVLAINEEPVRSVEELREAVTDLKKGDTVALLIERSGAQIFVPVQVSG